MDRWNYASHQNWGQKLLFVLRFLILNVPAELEWIAFTTLLDMAQYTITSMLIEPGQTAGNPTQPFHAREGKKNADHWNEQSVLELVDVDERGKPIASGATKALQFAATSVSSES
jgi:hypothetical protein